MGTNSTGCTEWERDFDSITEQPIFAKLKTFADARMLDESQRIQTVLLPEMKKAYL